jgi:hypothetical protein
MAEKIDIEKMCAPFNGSEIIAIRKNRTLYTVYDSDGQYIATVKFDYKKKDSSITLKEGEMGRDKKKYLDYLVNCLVKSNSLQIYDAMAVFIDGKRKLSLSTKFKHTYGYV